MKKTILTIGLLMGVLTSSAQLNTAAQTLRESENTDLNIFYEKIKCIAEAKWDGDNSMIVYTINKEADAFFEMLELKQQLADEYFNKSWNKWYDENCETTQWSMVVYDLKKQIKNSDY